MARRHVSDLAVVRAYDFCNEYQPRDFNNQVVWPYHVLMQVTGECMKVCYRAMERSFRRGLVDYGVSLRAGWLTPRGKELLVLGPVIEASAKELLDDRIMFHKVRTKHMSFDGGQQIQSPFEMG